ncbi:DNA polymerase subunit gamma-2, mitochondrial isoform X2 [Thalassophryne amazonica]|nr:DNA polymerase subunit gamma-2, mitochondrial isoform X2 [Thalassophryne amazonica]
MVTSRVGRVLSHPVSTCHIRRPWNRSESTARDVDAISAFLRLCVDRHFIPRAHANSGWGRGGTNCGGFGPLGAELRRNLLDQWWRAVTGSTAQVFGINSLISSKDTPTNVRLVESEVVNQLLDQQELSKDQLIQKVRALLQSSASLRTSFLQGALEQYVPLLDLVNRKLPFGLAESGPCFQHSYGSNCPVEVTQTSLVWFCSPRTSSRWLDHWARHRLKWWRKFSLSPSHFSSSDVPEQELEEVVSRGVRIYYSFPWGDETLETLWSRGDTELLKTHKGDRDILQCRDGRKSIPHVISVTGNMDCGVMAYLYNSFQQLKREDGKQKLQQRKVVKLHPLLTPVKVALDIGKGATVELRQVCEGLLQEFLEAKIFAWPGYLETTQISMEQLNAK